MGPGSGYGGVNGGGGDSQVWLLENKASINNVSQSPKEGSCCTVLWVRVKVCLCFLPILRGRNFVWGLGPNNSLPSAVVILCKAENGGWRLFCSSHDTFVWICTAFSIGNVMCILWNTLSPTEVLPKLKGIGTILIFDQAQSSFYVSEAACNLVPAIVGYVI